jgi:hypothetical protein
VPFIQDYLEYTKDYESPTSFWRWSAYATIAAVLRDNIYKKQGDITTYPNIYVLLLAQSAGRKGHPINLGQRLIASVNNTKIISGRSSIQAIIDELAHTETNAKTGKLIKGGSAIFIASELAAGLVSDDAAVGILTDIYDLKTDFKHHLRSTGRLKIDRIVFSMLAASNADLLKGVYNQSAIHGGLLGRTFLIAPNEFRPPNSLLDIADTTRAIELIEGSIKKISELQGEVFISQEAKEEYDNWYKPYYRSLEKKGDKSGVLGRLHMGVFKLAMIIMANDNEMQMRRCHVEEAIAECMALIPNYNAFTMGAGKSTISEAGGILIPELLESQDYMISRKKFLQKHWVNVDGDILDKLALTLESAGLLTTIVSANEIFYKLTNKALEAMRGKPN